ncbi:MAG: hypothetical protein II920_09680 [Clostridia bacterium]|nr:hypothetical protein [Clostridia bacterium]
MKRYVIAALALMLACAMGFQAFTENAGDYERAMDLMQQGDYLGAAQTFQSLSGYMDSNRYAMYCYAVVYAERGEYEIAITNLRSLTGLTGFLDSGQLSVYYDALKYESLEDYETAGSILENISLYKDSAARTASYPEKIHARDYRKADALEKDGYSTRRIITPPLP